jgi:hypothetical protein
LVLAGGGGGGDYFIFIIYISNIFEKMTNYFVAVPTYNRPDVVGKKTLTTLKEGGVPSSSIYLFVANKEQEKLYLEAVPRELYGKIVVGKIGISNQRKFICQYFPLGKYVVSIDDDVEQLEMLRGDKLVKVKDVDRFFEDAYKMLLKEKLFIWGIYPVRNPFFMKKTVTTDLKFVIGTLYGFINRRLQPSGKIKEKEDYELSILHYLKDGGVLRYNNITIKTKFHAEGGLGKTDGRFKDNKFAAEFLSEKYPDLASVFYRDNGMAEIRLSRRPRFYP